MTRSSVLVVMAAALVVGACSARGDRAERSLSAEQETVGFASVSESQPPAASGRRPGENDRDAAAGTTTSVDSGPPGSVTTVSSAPPASTTSTTSEQPGADSLQGPSGVVTDVLPRCVARPGEVEILVETAPLADVSHGVAFSDGHSHGQFGVGRADRAGRYRWTALVPATAPLGPATVAVSSADADGRGGSGTAQFDVAETGGC